MVAATPGRALLTSSSSGYNLGLDKLGSWLRSLGWVTELNPARDNARAGFDLYAFSAVFTWDLPAMAKAVASVANSPRIWIGGPAPSAMPGWVEKRTGIAPVVGADPRFEREPGSGRWCRTTRGCPVGCYFCIVPKIDGKSIVEYEDFKPAPVVVDDNLLRASWGHQVRVVERLASASFASIDLNSGFDIRVLEQKHIDLYGQLPLGRWRVAFDEMRQWREVRRAIRMLRANGIPAKKIPCYVLAGNEPFEQCLWRARKVVEWGGEPRIQMLRPLTWLSPRQQVWVNPRLDWTIDQTVNFPRYWYSYAWRRMEWEEWVRAGFRYSGDMTSHTPGLLRATRASAAARWLSPEASSESDHRVVFQDV